MLAVTPAEQAAVLCWLEGPVSRLTIDPRGRRLTAFGRSSVATVDLANPRSVVERSFRTIASVEPTGDRFSTWGDDGGVWMHRPAGASPRP